MYPSESTTPVYSASLYYCNLSRSAMSQCRNSIKIVIFMLCRTMVRKKSKYSILFYSILFYSILFYSILFYSIHIEWRAELFDTDRSGSINLQEFSALFNYINDWKRMFESIDRDRSGFIEEAELAQGRRSPPPPLHCA